MTRLPWLAALFLSACATPPSGLPSNTAPAVPTTAALDAEVNRAMAATHARGLAIVILSNEVRAETAFPHLVAFAMGATGMPWTWEYGNMPMWDAITGTVAEKSSDD